MRQFQLMTLLACGVMALSACSSNEDLSYLGSRDDIIVQNRGVVSQPVKEESKQVEEAAMKAAAEEVEPVKTIEVKKTEALKTEKVEAEKVEVAVPEIEVKPTQATPVQETAPPKMDTITMKSPEEPKPKTAAAPMSSSSDIPPNAKPGECYAKVLIPAVTETQTERVQVSEEQEVLSRIIPARYEIQTERVLVKEARQYWKPGEGPITKKDEVTGKIMCLVEEPAVYKTIEKRVLVEAEKPEYKTVPAQFQTITKTNIIQPESWEWRRILCETNMGPNSIQRIQAALRSKGYDIKVDGKAGSQTMSALNDYQMKNGLATKGITYETLDHLGVQLLGA